MTCILQKKGLDISQARSHSHDRPSYRHRSLAACSFVRCTAWQHPRSA
ncbi:hypothetical protein N9T54_04245 [Alphaproteobacteria bacterium]|nr:hypothetical protein [Alphaproteobacteria bacterium]